MLSTMARLSWCACGAMGRAAVRGFSGPEVHPGNLNATPAIVRSARSMSCACWPASSPLNEGLMRDVALVVPEASPRGSTIRRGARGETAARRDEPVWSMLVRALAWLPVRAR
jgi:hypothetical protein